MMKSRWVYTLSVLTVLLSGCSAIKLSDFASPSDFVPLSQIQVLDRFVRVELTKENFVAEARKCIPPMTVSSAQSEANKFPYPNGMAKGIGHASAANVFWVKGAQGICVQTTSARYPIWAAEMLWGTDLPTGVPPDVMQTWNRQIVKEIAMNGIARVLYSYSNNGNAYLVKYWADQTGHQSNTIFYSSEFKKAGSWSATDGTFHFTHPTQKGFKQTQRSDQAQKTIFDN